MRLLLINPRFPENFWSFKWALETARVGKRAVNPPLGLATLAALSPPDWDVSIVDENVESIPLAPAADLIGVCGMGVQAPRQRELLAFYRRQGHRVVAGGSYASLCPERLADVADTVIAGEAEYIWPEYCRDAELGTTRALYQETGEVSLLDSPVPRFDLLRVDKYQMMSLQFSRGCPYRCEFCDIIVMFGRKPRTKSPSQIASELDALRTLGVRDVFFVDDNLIGNKPLAKELLRSLGAYQRTKRYRFHFGTEASMNVAQDPELLSLLREANFGWLFLGIESPDEASLKETRKFQNIRGDLLESVRTIYRHGIDVFAGFIVGFDNDTVSTFAKQREFIERSGIQAAMVGLLTAAPKTPLYERLTREGRIIAGGNDSDNVNLGTNVLPKRMSYVELLAGYRTLYQHLFSDRGIALRVKNKLRHLGTPVGAGQYRVRELATIFRRVLLRGILHGGMRRMGLFVTSLPWLRPRLMVAAVTDWVLGLSMRDYIDRHFTPVAHGAGPTVRDRVRALERALRRYRDAGALEVGLADDQSAACELSMRISGLVDRRFVRRTTRHLRTLLRDTASSVTLRIDDLHAAEVRHVERMLGRLAHYGDRIRVSLPRRLRTLIHVDSSIFCFVLDPALEAEPQ
jgi:radical SAM superfamily enzyme YgiQ (UPF0313 family)